MMNSWNFLWQFLFGQLPKDSYQESIFNALNLLFWISLIESKGNMVVFCLIYFFIFNSVFMDDLMIESNPSFLGQNLQLKNIAATFMLEKQKLEQMNTAEKPRRSICFYKFCPQKIGQRHNNEDFKRLWYSYAFWICVRSMDRTHKYFIEAESESKFKSFSCDILYLVERVLKSI